MQNHKDSPEKLVFVLGAGASSHFGYPLGSQLIKAMEMFLKTISVRNKNEYEKDGNIQRAREFLTQIQSYNPLNIDYYLHNNPDEEEMGKRLIEATILHCQNSKLFKHNTREEIWWKKTMVLSEKKYVNSANWVKFIHHKIVANCKTVDDVIKELNDITIITFNYDLSFEQALWEYFKKSKFEKVREFLFSQFYEKNVIHINGKVSNKNLNGEPVKDDYECLNFDADGDQAYTRFLQSDGGGIEIVGVDKAKPNSLAVERIKEAHLLYLLGYAFDEFNNYVIGLDTPFQLGNKNFNFYYTNMAGGAIVDSKVRSFFDPYDIRSFGADSRIKQAFRTREDDAQLYGNIVKSEKNVYKALEEDLFIPVMKKLS